MRAPAPGLAACVITCWLFGCASEERATAPGLQAAPVAVRREPDQVTQHRLAAANAARKAGEYEQALMLLREILADNPTLTGAYLEVAEIFVEQEDYERAEPVYARAARLDPHSFEAQYGHGVALQMLDRFVEAVKAYHRALTIEPDSVNANRHLATTYLQMNKPTSALIFARKAVEGDPSDGPAHAALAAAYESVGRDHEAIVEYEAAIELMNPSPPLLMNLINVLARQDRYVDAKNTAEFLVRMAPSANAYERLGWAYFRLGDYERSLEAYRNAVQIDPRHWPSLNGVGCNAINKWLLSNKTNADALDEARRAFRASLQVNRDQPRLVKVLLKYGVSY